MKKGSTILVVIVMCLFLCMCGSIFSGGSSGGSRDTNTCGYCKRTYEAGDSGGNYMSIARTNLCKNCYNNYKWGQAAMGR